MTTPDPGVYISPSQTYAEVQNLVKTVSRIESKVDRFLDEAKDIRQDVSDHEVRIRALEHGNTERQRAEANRADAVDSRLTGVERRIWAAGGAATILASGAGIVFQFLIR
ncbi:hypothetical protein [Streptomyces thermoviolaceus]|uniref:hypothetical protein n=1 Tax=Streptomyces thermoviolaceus TaxID=1952 RepID=UPI0016762824|nr:hypothetical protein [Streptomyces thermoviolaceus]GGV80521.1 hypothetical protein GCM10010499_43630 [Streptomyces thermoviolaceus subsp. apingens]